MLYVLSVFPSVKRYTSFPLKAVPCPVDGGRTEFTHIIDDRGGPIVQEEPYTKHYEGCDRKRKGDDRANDRSRRAALWLIVNPEHKTKNSSRTCKDSSANSKLNDTARDRYVAKGCCSGLRIRFVGHVSSRIDSSQPKP